MALRSGCPNASKAVYTALSPFCSPATQLPAFLVPCLRQQHMRSFSATTHRPSKIGAAPLSIPEDVKFTITSATASPTATLQADRVVDIVGPLGKMSMTIPPYLQISESEDGRVRHVTVQDPKNKQQRSMWGTVRAYLRNHILGVSEGHAAILRLIGVGYRATVEDKAITKTAEYPGQKFVSLKVGYSHPIELGVPMGVKASTPQPTRILLEGVEKEVVKEFAAKIRAWRKPEPYKGKGIFVNDETIKLKAKKIK